MRRLQRPTRAREALEQINLLLAQIPAPHAGAGGPKTGRGRPAGGTGGSAKRKPPCAKQGGLVGVVGFRPLRLAAADQEREAGQREHGGRGLGDDIDFRPTRRCLSVRRNRRLC